MIIKENIVVIINYLSIKDKILIASNKNAKIKKYL